MMSMASISEMRMRWQDNAFAAGLSTLSTCQNRAACQIDSHEKDPSLQKKAKKLKSPQKHLSTTVAVYMLLYLFPCMITIAFHSYSINSQS
jgi:hypothetical protein